MSEDRKDREKYEAYPNTILEFLAAPVLRIDLREEITSEQLEGLRRIGLSKPFAVLTAENPGGENVEDAPSERQAEAQVERNERRTSRLEAELARSKVPFAVVDGVSPDGAYREHCLAAVLGQRDAVALAKRLDQLALFWFDGECFWLLPADADQSPTRLPRAKPAAPSGGRNSES